MDRTVTITTRDVIGFYNTGDDEFVSYDQAVVNMSGTKEEHREHSRLLILDKREPDPYQSSNVEVIAVNPVFQQGAQIRVFGVVAHEADDDGEILAACHALALLIAQDANKLAGHKRKQGR